MTQLLIGSPARQQISLLAQGPDIQSEYQGPKGRPKLSTSRFKARISRNCNGFGAKLDGRQGSLAGFPAASDFRPTYHGLRGRSHQG
jgi:hypothetical protein